MLGLDLRVWTGRSFLFLSPEAASDLGYVTDDRVFEILVRDSPDRLLNDEYRRLGHRENICSAKYFSGSESSVAYSPVKGVGGRRGGNLPEHYIFLPRLFCLVDFDPANSA